MRLGSWLWIAVLCALRMGTAFLVVAADKPESVPGNAGDPLNNSDSSGTPAALPVSVDDTKPRLPQPVDYLREVKPLFAKRCYACHGALQQKSELRVDTAEFLRRGGTEGPAIVSGKPDESVLLEVITGSGGRLMPPEGEGTPFNPDEISLIRRWVAEGAAAPQDEKPQIDPKLFWSYQPIRRSILPTTVEAAWVNNPIDAYISAQHLRMGLRPSPEASRSIWLRRVCLDLIGLPPDRAEFQAFLNDHSPDAYERVVDRLLERPEYGERWGRHWMDIWRYSDWYGSRGINEIRYSQRHIWRWRDWIVESLNQDKGYNQMIVEMLAGDELSPANPDVTRATGFVGRNWYKFDRNVWMFDVVEHTSQAFLGLTLKCCRCHDHKFDPISQEEYFQFRAFFEPHSVRTDPIGNNDQTEKDATLGTVLKEGVARVYDKDLDVKTFLFQRGDSRYPDEKRLLAPAVPKSLGNPLSEIASIDLPVEAFYPALHAEVASRMIANADFEVANARKAIADAQTIVLQKQAMLEQSRQTSPAVETDETEGKIVFHDNFMASRPAVWKKLSGDWDYIDGHLIQKSVEQFATFVSNVDIPEDFDLKITYRTLSAGTLRSIGFSFDYLDQGNSQDVYTHLNDNSQGIQAFHRDGGQQHYPSDGIVLTKGLLQVGAPIIVEAEVRGQSLVLKLNGERKLDYRMPLLRRKGKLAIWTHLGTAQFDEVEIRGPAPTLKSLELDVLQAANQVALCESKLNTVVAQRESLKARIDAERAKYLKQKADRVLSSALAASRAEKQVDVAKAEEEVLTATQLVNSLSGPKIFDQSSQRSASGSSADSRPEASAKKEATPALSTAADMARQKLDVARAKLEKAKQGVAEADGAYTSLGTLYPTKSTGRRLALARWITDSQNPRTARIAINHIWLRHFGQGFVSTVSNFGMNGDLPTHPELLDWLAAELMEKGWSMKHIHRLIVLSNTYRMQSTPGAADSSNQTLDKQNRYLWRMNVRRMEAELVRDSVLAVCGELDLQRGGPEIPESQGLTNLRRSLYFRITPNEKMKFLDLFDVADPNACYRRRESIIPQQALALLNSGLALDQSRLLAEKITREVGDKDSAEARTAFVQAAWLQILCENVTSQELSACLNYLEKHSAGAVDLASGNPEIFPAGGQSRRPPSVVPHLRARENLIQVLLSHNLFVTIR